MCDHIAKPIDPQALYSTLRRWLGRRTPTEAAAPVLGVAGLDAVEDLNQAAGLRYAGGNRELYLRVLRQFAQKEADAAARVSAALAAGDRGTALRIAHTVKGLAGSVGLGALQADAARLEEALRGGGAARSELAAFERRLAGAVRALGQALGAEPARHDGGDGAQHLGRLARLLAAADGEAVSYFMGHAGAIRSAVADDYAAIERAVNDFDFEAALSRLRRAASTRGIALQEEAS
jgi:HPt (histidine-containing phosphotransfer) domain-containing protein